MMTFMDESLDYYAQANALRDVNSYLKLVLGMGAILICVASPGPLAPLFILVTLSAITLFFAKIPVRVYGELLLIPVTFVGISVIAIVFLSGGGTDPDIFYRGYPADYHNRLSKSRIPRTGPDLRRYVRTLLYCPDNPHNRDLFRNAYAAGAPRYRRSFHVDLPFYLRLYRTGNSDP